MFFAVINLDFVYVYTLSMHQTCIETCIKYTHIYIYTYTYTLTNSIRRKHMPKCHAKRKTHLLLLLI